MPGSFKTCIFSLLTLTILLSKVVGQTPASKAISFDVPAALAVSLEPMGEVAATGVGGDQLLKVLIPVSSEIQTHSKQSIDTFRFDIFWNQTAYPVSDYSPRTQTIAEIQGEIATETARETKAGFGLSINADLQSIVQSVGSAEAGTSNLVKKKFKQLPDQSILVASGTSHRGTGVFFRFHRSSQTTLEGGRELTAQFQVPPNWRAGILRVNCFASGATNLFGGWTNPFETSRTFLVPIYRAGDSKAKAAALTFVGAEQQLRQRWRDYESSNAKASPISFSTILVSTSASNHKLPNQWAHLLIQTGNDDYLEKYRSQLPATLQTSADNFVAARQALYGLR